MTRPMSEEREKALKVAAHVLRAEEVHGPSAVILARALLATSASERGMREAAVALSKEVDRMWNDPHRFNPPAWESHAKAICSAQQDLSAAIETATIAGDAS